LPTLDSPSQTHSSSESTKWDNTLIKWEGTQASTRTDINIIENINAQDTVTQSSSTHSAHFSQSQNAVVLKDASQLKYVDLSSVEKCPAPSEKQFNDNISTIETKITLLLEEMSKIQPNMHAEEKYEMVLQKLQKTSEELEQLKNVVKDVSMSYELVKKQRMELFQVCFKHISESLGVIYKDLTQSSKHPLGGNAFLTIDNTEEPYLGGVRFTAMVISYSLLTLLFLHVYLLLLFNIIIFSFPFYCSHQ
jgi:structural maintenance of chromosome 1